jgi:hypothetical protein
VLGPGQLSERYGEDLVIIAPGVKAGESGEVWTECTEPWCSPWAWCGEGRGAGGEGGLGQVGLMK